VRTLPKDDNDAVDSDRHHRECGYDLSASWTDGFPTFQAAVREDVPQELGEREPLAHRNFGNDRVCRRLEQAGHGVR
jgi:hypothetical protein